MNQSEWDCIVVGAGVAGLRAARELARQGRRVLVLEARDRVGGRTCTVMADCGMPVDVGGQWLGPGQDRALALAAELELALWAQPQHGRNLLKLHGKQRSFQGNIPSLPLFSLLEMQANIWRLEALARRIVAEAPGDSPGAERWDAMTVAQWMQRHVHSKLTRTMFIAAVHAVFSTEPESISMLQFLFYLKSAGGLMPLISAEGGAQEQRISGGAQQLSEGLARQAREAGAELRLNCPVRAIETGADQITVATDIGSEIAARVIVAMAPSQMAGIAFSPALPARRRQLIRHMPMGSVIKVNLIYDRPFWRDAGLSGEMVCDEAPLRMTFDATPPDSQRGALVGFILGEQAVRWSERPEAERRAAVCAQLATFYGDSAGNPQEYIEKDWCADTWAAGCYVGLMTPGELSKLGALVREPVGRVHWAGTETATQWNGYIEGALQSGERAAAEVLAESADDTQQR